MSTQNGRRAERDTTLSTETVPGRHQSIAKPAFWISGTQRSISDWMKSRKPVGVFFASSGISRPSGARRARRVPSGRSCGGPIQALIRRFRRPGRMAQGAGGFHGKEGNGRGLGAGIRWAGFRRRRRHRCGLCLAWRSRSACRATPILCKCASA
jgi:hypothetical protein